MSSSVETSAIPFHLYRDARLSKTAGVKKRTFWVLLIALLRTTYVKTSNNKHIFTNYKLIEFKSLSTYSWLQRWQNQIDCWHPVLLQTRIQDVRQEFYSTKSTRHRHSKQKWFSVKIDLLLWELTLLQCWIQPLNSQDHPLTRWQVNANKEYLHWS